jgi:hypothetical protein
MCSLDALLTCLSWPSALGMGVVGDESRTSTVVADKPFMGLVPESTTSWAEEEYSQCHVNTCWELYGVTDEDHFPSSGAQRSCTSLLKV